tara:strand:- start:6760 stop:7734 length:975 start_codon:yes stop_codon:yes gene_type:complete
LKQFLPPKKSDLLSAGFDIGGTSIRGLALGHDRELTQLHQKKHLGDLKSIVNSIVDISMQIQITTNKKIRSIGIGCAGLVDSNGVVKTSPNIQAIENFPLRTEVEEKMQIPVLVENDANCAAWAEAKLGSAQNSNNAIVVSFGTGIGAGILLNGELQKGASGYAGEIGHMVIEKEGLACPCGKRGCWEQYASGSALGKIANEVLDDKTIIKMKSKTDFQNTSITSEQIGIAAQENHPEAIRVIKVYSEQVAIGLGNLTKALDPEVIILGGAITAIGEPLLQPIKESYAEIADSGLDSANVEIRLARFGNKAGSIGAAIFANQIL